MFMFINTLSLYRATVFISFGYILLIWATPLPTTPKFSAEPKASTLGACGDHFTEVFANFYFIPPCIEAGLSIIYVKLYVNNYT